MRDLHAVGPAQESRLDLEDETAPSSPEQIAQLERQYRTVKREQKMASVAVMLIDAAKILEPVVELLNDRALRWAALVSTLGLTGYALAHPSWERAAIVGGFAILAPWVIRRGK